METIVLVVHIILAISIVAVVLIQPSEGGMGAMGGGGSPLGGITTARGAASLLTRITALLVTGFIATSLILAIMAGRQRVDESILELIPQEAIVEEAQEQVPAPTNNTERPDIPISQ